MQIAVGGELQGQPRRGPGESRGTRQRIVELVRAGDGQLRPAAWTDRDALPSSAAFAWPTAGLTLQLAGDGNLHIYQSGTTTNVVPPYAAAGLNSVAVTGLSNAAEALTVDLSGGQPIPAGGITLNGGTGGGNSLSVIGAPGGNSVVMSAAQITDNGMAPIYYSNVTYFGFDLGGGTNSLTIAAGATLKINQDNAIAAGINVTNNGGILDLNGKTDTIGNLLLKSGSVINGTLHANSYNIESGTATANIVGPGGLQKTTAAQATAGAISAPNVTLGAGELTATSIITGTLTLGPGTTLTIAAIPGGPSASRVLRPLAARSLQPISYESASQPAVADTAVQSTTVQSAAVQSSSAAIDAVNAEPQDAAQPTAIDAVLQSSLLAEDAIAAPAMPATTTGQSSTTATSLNSLSNAIINAVAAPALIVADMDQPTGLSQSSTATKPIDTANYHLLPQSPLYSWLDLTAFGKVIESGQEQSLSTSIGNTAGSPILGSLRDELPSRASKFAEHPTSPATNSRQAQFATLQTVLQNSRSTDTAAEVDFDIAQHVPAGKHSKQLSEQAIDEVWAEEEDLLVEL